MEKRNGKFSEDNQLNVITKKIIGCAFKVGYSLGNGFLEKVYENALSHELRKIGLKVDQEYACSLIFTDQRSKCAG